MAGKNPRSNEPWTQAEAGGEAAAATSSPPATDPVPESPRAGGRAGDGAGSTANGGTGRPGGGGPLEPKLSRFSKPIRDNETRAAIFREAGFLRDAVREQVIAKANRQREQDPLKLRTMAIDAGMSTALKRRLLRVVQSGVASAGGSTLLQSFPQLGEAIIYEALADAHPDEIPDLEPEDLRGPAEEFVRQQHVTLYTDRIRQVLADSGIDVADGVIAAIYEDMNRRRVPLPVRSREGVLA